MTTLDRISTAITTGAARDARTLAQQALDEGLSPVDIVDRGLVPAMALVGDRFKRAEIFVPEMLIAARAMKEAMAVLEPRLVAAGVVPKYTAVIGTVQGDLHDIGKNLVATMWKGANFRVIDLGANVPPAKFVAAVQAHQPHLVGLSALLTTTMPAMAATVRALRADAVPAMKVIIGGAPVTREFATEIGADGFAPDAGSAVDAALELVRTAETKP